MIDIFIFLSFIFPYLIYNLNNNWRNKKNIKILRSLDLATNMFGSRTVSLAVHSPNCFLYFVYKLITHKIFNVDALKNKEKRKEQKIDKNNRE